MIAVTSSLVYRLVVAGVLRRSGDDADGEKAAGPDSPIHCALPSIAFALCNHHDTRKDRVGKMMAGSYRKQALDAFAKGLPWAKNPGDAG